MTIKYGIMQRGQYEKEHPAQGHDAPLGNHIVTASAS